MVCDALVKIGENRLLRILNDLDKTRRKEGRRGRRDKRERVMWRKEQRGKLSNKKSEKINKLKKKEK